MIQVTQLCIVHHNLVKYCESAIQEKQVFKVVCFGLRILVPFLFFFQWYDVQARILALNESDQIPKCKEHKCPYGLINPSRRVFL